MKWIVLALLSIFPCPSIQAAEPLRIILDTDISSDVDDVGAVAVLHTLADAGQAEILAMFVSSGDPWSLPCLDAVNTWCGRPDIPIGAVRGPSVVHESKYTREIAGHFTHDTGKSNDAPDAVQLYRSILASNPDNSVTIISVGYLTNLARLLQSPPDTVSPLPGVDLVAQKVRHFVCMGGQYPAGREWNFYQDVPATMVVLNEWPGAITFCGFEAGRDIYTGPGLRQSREDNPIRRSYELYNSLSNRPSWDQLAVLYALNYQKQMPWVLSETGCAILSADGSNTWQSGSACNHRYLKVSKSDRKALRDTIEQLMIRAADQEQMNNSAREIH